MGKNIVVVGGGAAGFFAAIACAEKNPSYRIIILEKSSQPLQKVKISGGGRCNVTHSCFEPHELVKNYPRGDKQLLGPFTKFNPQHTIAWFRERGVALKTEEDGRMFPVTDSSQTIIDCFLRETANRKIAIQQHAYVEALDFFSNKNRWVVNFNKSESIEADAVIITTGSSERMWSILAKLGVNIVPPVPSLFTFNIQDEKIKGLEGLSVPEACVSVVRQRLRANGPLLITHWGISGPAVLRLSAWGTRYFSDLNYQFDIDVNWLNLDNHRVKETLLEFKKKHAKKNAMANPLFNLPKRLWQRLASSATLNSNQNFADLSLQQTEHLAALITASRFKVQGKATFKDEFVTAGGVDLKEVDFKTMQLKKLPGLFVAGEALDIDAITGGFNFQAAWTTGWIAGNAV